MSRADQFDITVIIKAGGSLATDMSLGTFDTFEGGEIDSEETKYWPGGLAAQISLGGRRSIGNVTVGKLYDHTADHPNMGKIAGLVGKNEVVITKTSLTIEDVAIAKPMVYTGKLKALTPPSHDSESTDAATWELEISSASVTQQ